MSQSLSGRNNLKDKIRKLYETNEFYDATFRVGSKTFKVHRLILSSRCSEFSRIFFDPDAAKTQIDIIVEDEAVTETGFEILLRFIYTDTLGTVDKLSIVEAYLAANHYKLKNLVKKCNDLIQTWTFTTDEVCELLNATLGIAELKRKCLNFIANNAGEIISLPSFLKLSYKAMIAVLDSDALPNVENKTRIRKIIEWGANKTNNPANYAAVRKYFLSNDPPLLPKLKIEELNLNEITELFTNTYEGFLTNEEVIKLIQYTYNKQRKDLLPEWSTTS